MRIKVGVPELVEDLLNLLSIDENLRATRAGVDEIDASVADSESGEHALVLMLLLRAWEAAHPDVALELS